MIEKVQYGEKLFDPRWKKKRREILERDNYKCTICSKMNGLHIHHKQYHFIKHLQVHVNPWDYNNNLMVTLCDSCHSRGHYKYKVPIKYI